MEREGPEKFPVPERGVRTNAWLYVRCQAGATHLYNLGEDPLERNNLVTSAAHEDVIERLDGMLVQHMRHTGDDWGL